MDCISLSDVEFAERVKNLSRLEIENLANDFNRKFEILRKEYQIKLEEVQKSPMKPKIPTEFRKIPLGKINNLIGILEKKPISYSGNKLTLKNPNYGTITIILYPDYRIDYIQNTNMKISLSSFVMSPVLSGTVIRGSISPEYLNETLLELIQSGWDL